MSGAADLNPASRAARTLRFPNLPMPPVMSRDLRVQPLYQARPRTLAPWRDRLRFLGAWLRDPRRVGAVAPSSPALARLICSQIDAAHAPVLELGPGTGVFTEALLARGVPAWALTLVESTPAFAHGLRRRYPEARVLDLDARDLAATPLFAEPGCVGAAVSGLPLRAMRPEQVQAIVAGVFHWLRPRASLFQFTYALRCPIPIATLHALDLQATALGRVARNLPPATVYRIERRR